MCAFSAAGKRTWPSDVVFALANYINDPNLIRCSVAVGTNAEIQGFKSLKRATQGNSYHVPVGWGIVGAYIDLSAAQRGLGGRCSKSHLRQLCPQLTQQLGQEMPKVRRIAKRSDFVNTSVTEMPSGRYLG